MGPGLIAAADEETLAARDALEGLAHAGGTAHARRIGFRAGDEEEVHHHRPFVQPLAIGDELVLVRGRMRHDDVEFAAPRLREDFA